jgi:hypothetical protein
MSFRSAAAGHLVGTRHSSTQNIHQFLPFSHHTYIPHTILYLYKCACLIYCDTLYCYYDYSPLENDTFTGYSWGVDHCPFRGKCTVEGVASSVALVERWIQQQQGANSADNSIITDRSILSELSDDDETWDHAANALASLCATLLLLLSVERIVLGGGVLKRAGLLEKIQKRTVVLLNGYLELPPSSNDNDDDEAMTLQQLITTSVHGDNAGLQGAIVLAQRAYYQGRGNRFNNSTNENGDADKEGLLQAKRQAFQIGWVHGLLVGAVATALVMRFASRRR